MREPLFGIETEYALTAIGADGRTLSRKPLLVDLLELAKRRYPHLPDAQAPGVYLENGSRLYLDCGRHPELSTPECSNPWDIVRYTLAGEQILSDLADTLKQRRGIPELSIFKCNVDYSGSRQTWGCHESYLHRADPERVAKQVIPHLVSRIIYTRAGGFNNFSPGIKFLLSPRVPHLVKTVSDCSTSNRGIFHSKDEPLCGRGFHRLHILCGESQCSERSAFLKVGVTALIVRLIEVDACRGEKVALHSPGKAMRVFASDASCQKDVALADGRRFNALAIQRHYLEDAERRLGQSMMPSWAEEVCGEWRHVLDQLENDREAIATSLDWRLKLDVFQDRARRRGIPWESLAAWNFVTERIAIARSLSRELETPLTPEVVLGRGSPVRDAVKALEGRLRSNGLSWDGLEPYLQLRSELFEIDTRFGQLGERGIFAALDREGMLSHRISKLGSVDDAVRNPPAGGRAELRGRYIHELQGHGGRYACMWRGITDHQRGRFLDLGDPFGSRARWRPAAPRKTRQRRVRLPPW